MSQRVIWKGICFLLLSPNNLRRVSWEPLHRNKPWQFISVGWILMMLSTRLQQISHYFSCKRTHFACLCALRTLEKDSLGGAHFPRETKKILMPLEAPLCEPLAMCFFTVSGTGQEANGLVKVRTRRQCFQGLPLPAQGQPEIESIFHFPAALCARQVTDCLFTQHFNIFSRRYFFLLLRRLSFL